MSLGNTISGNVSFSGPATIKVISSAPTYTYNYTPGDNLFYMIDYNGAIGFAYEDPSLVPLMNNSFITVSGITGEYSSLNGTTFTGNGGNTALPGGTFNAAYAALGFGPFNFSPQTDFPGMTWGWN